MVFTGAVAALNAVSTVADAVNNKSIDDIVQFAKDNKTILMVRGGSLTSVAGKFTIEPTIYVSESLRGDSKLDSVITNQVGYYRDLIAQSAKILVEHYSIQPAIVTELLSTDLDIVNMALESEKDYLTVTDILRGSDNSNKTGFEASPDAIYTEDVETTVVLGKDRNGREISLTLPYMVRANVVFVPYKDILNVVSTHDDEKTSSIVDSVMSGMSNMMNIIFPIEQYKRYRLKINRDENDIVKDIEKTTRTAYAKLVKYGIKGYEEYARMFIVTNDELKSLTRKLKLKLSRVKDREKLNDALKAISVVDFDSVFKTVTIYNKDNNVVTIPFKKLDDTSISRII